MNAGLNEPDEIVALVTHARSVGAGERTRFARTVRTSLADGADGAVILETCHRVEVYGGMRPPELRTLEAALPAGGQALIGEAAIRHMIAVAVGRDSVVVGEDQILHQLRETSAAARPRARPNAVLERLLASALRAGRRARSWQHGPRRSLADVALAMIARRDGPMLGRDVLVVGAGTMGQLAARAAKVVGASVAIASRSDDRAREVSAEIDAIPLPFDPGDRIEGFSGIVVALAGPWSISRPTMNTIAGGQATLVDLSVPAALPIELRQAIGPRLIEADDLARDDMAADVLPERWLARLDALIDATATEFIEWLDQRASRSAANALVERAEREREAELVALARRLPELEPEALEAIDAMTRHLAARLLREPLERLGRDSDGQAERAVREIFAL